MKVTYPLSLKVSLWLLLNLVLLSAAAVTFYVLQFGRGWDSLTAGALGERLHAVADRTMAEIYAASTPAEREAVLAERARATGAQFYVFLNQGTQVHGEAVTLPAALAEELGRGMVSGSPRGKKGPPRGGPELSGKSDFRARGPAGRSSGFGRMVFREERETWLGVRVPLLRENAPPAPATLVVRAPDLFAIIRVIDLLPWFWAAVAAFALSVLFWLPLVSGITRAVRRLNAATEAIAEGRFDTRVPENRRDELGQLGGSVNRMAARLDTLVNGQKRFLGDVAHELGSPLGRLQVATEILEMRADSTLREHVQDVREEVQQMAALVNELLAFTKAGLRPRDAELTAVDLPSLIIDVLDREDPARRVPRPTLPSQAVQADRALLARAVGNLVRNALRYAGEHAAIAVRMEREPHRVRLVVEDTGPGVPHDALARLGEPFYRPEAARTRETGGVGLGLAIVRSSVAACGGEVQFANRAPQGFVAIITLPIAPSG
jgi:two-component system sensor histidine kinase CpxA